MAPSIAGIFWRAARPSDLAYRHTSDLTAEPTAICVAASNTFIATTQPSADAHRADGLRAPVVVDAGPGRGGRGLETISISFIVASDCVAASTASTSCADARWRRLAQSQAQA